MNHPRMIAPLAIAALLLVPLTLSAAEPTPDTILSGLCSRDLAESASELRGSARRSASAGKLADAMVDLVGLLSPTPPADKDVLAELAALSGRVEGRFVAALGASQVALDRLLSLATSPELTGATFALDMRHFRDGASDARTAMLEASLFNDGLMRDVGYLQENPGSISQIVIDRMATAALGIRDQAKLGAAGMRTLDGPWGSWVKAFKISNLARAMKRVVSIYTCGGMWVTIMGTDGDDYLEGTMGVDVINGLGGNDEIWGDPEWANQVDGGADVICGGDGDDDLWGKANDDVIYGGPGNDTIHGGRHHNTIFAGAGDDYVHAGGGSLVYMGSGHDTVFGGTCDESYCESMDDIIYGEGGDDSLHGNSGDDIIYGGDGSDFIYGTKGNNVLYGGKSNGNLNESGGGYPMISWPGGLTCGGPSWDYIFGGSGTDVVYGEEGQDYIRGGGGNDYLNGGLTGYYSPEDDPDNGDCIWGEEGNDTLYGRGGRDFLDGGDGDDIIFGHGGDDLLVGHAGDDTIYGDEGNDVLNGDKMPCDSTTTEGNDSLYGGPGDDILRGGPLNDLCDGGTGVDDAAPTCETLAGIP